MFNVIPITSPNNEQLKKWKKLHTRKGRLQSGLLLVEGEHLFAEALSAGITFRAVLVDEGIHESVFSFLREHPVNTPVYSLSSSLFSSVVETDSPQGIAAVIDQPAWTMEQVIEKSDQPATFLLLDAVQDPGNVGTMIRTAEAAGVRGLLLGKGTVDLFNSKVVRSAMGSVFRLPAVQVDLMQAIPVLKQKGVTIVGTSPYAGTYHFHYSYPERTAILLGNEGRGVDSAFHSWLDAEVLIPMPGRTESLNVSITSAILLYEIVRQQYPRV